MEKKTKKLQLKKETVAILNGEKMTHVVGGVDPNGCWYNGRYYQVNQIFFDGENECVCNGNGQVVCSPGNLETSRGGEICSDATCSRDTCNCSKYGPSCGDSCVCM